MYVYITQDEGVPQLTTTVTITVDVTDTPDDPPVPHQKHYYGYLAEGSYTFSVSTKLEISKITILFTLKNDYS